MHTNNNSDTNTFFHKNPFVHAQLQEDSFLKILSPPFHPFHFGHDHF